MLPSVNKILYTTDLGVDTQPALCMAMSLAEKHQAQVTFLHVIEPISQMVFVSQSEKFWQKVREDNMKASVRLAEKCLSNFYNEEQLKDTLDRPKIVIEYGRVADTILQTADDIDADLIIMGTHSHTALGELILGSVADKVMRMSRRPILLVPTTEKAANS